MGLLPHDYYLTIDLGWDCDCAITVVVPVEKPERTKAALPDLCCYSVANRQQIRPGLPEWPERAIVDR